MDLANVWHAGALCLVANPCASRPCKNGATCTALSEPAHNYTCNCTSDFQGRNCEKRTLHLSLYRISQKNCTVLFLRYLLQPSLYFHHFWDAYTPINFRSPACFIFFITRKLEDRPAYVSTVQHASAPCTHRAASSSDIRFHYITQPVAS